jgi:hypothetical protein
MKNRHPWQLKNQNPGGRFHANELYEWFYRYAIKMATITFQCFYFEAMFANNQALFFQMMVI